MKLPTNYDHIQCPICGENIFISISQDDKECEISCDKCHFKQINKKTNVDKNDDIRQAFPAWYVDIKAKKFTKE